MQRPFKYLDENISVRIAESFEHLVWSAQTWSELSSVSYVMLNAMGAFSCYIGLADSQRNGADSPW